MNGNSPINFAAAAKQASQGELNFRCVTVRLRHAREDLSRVVEPVIDQMVEADVVVARQSDCAGRAIAAPQYPAGEAD